jgi:TolA-binding protein
MRLHLLTAFILAGVSMPAIAQKAPVDRRVDKLEQEMRAVQRKVFPGGNVEPEIRQPVEPAVLGGVPAGSAVSDLNARVDALEAQLATLTGQIEQNGFRTRQLEEALNRFRTDSEARLAQIESARPAPAQVAAAEVQEPARVAASQPATTAAAPPTPSGSAMDAGEQAYLVGFRLWEQGKFGEAQAALEAMARKYPKHPRASYARNLAGRALLDDGKAATAAKVLLSNYQINPKGERAADSLLFLGEALMKLNKPAEACQVYNELQDVYAPTMRDFIKQRLPKARAEAKCS